MRAFISIEFPEEIKRELISVQKEIDKLGLIKGKFSEPENLHLTLKFLGNISDVELRAVEDKLSSLKFSPFYIDLSDLGVFSENFIRIIWAGLNGRELFETQKNIDVLLEDIFPREYRFMAHTTLARPKYVEDRKMFLSELRKINLGKKKFLVDKILLKESELSSKGASYKTLLEISALKEEKITA